MILKYNARHFGYSEFDCRCADSKCHMKGENATFSALVLIGLDLIRERLKMPVRVNSGRRCVAHNAAVGGAQNPISRHTKAEAADISCADYAALVSVAVPVCEFLGLRLVRYDNEKFLHIQTK